jgi:hypothetical protein
MRRSVIVTFALLPSLLLAACERDTVPADEGEPGEATDEGGPAEPEATDDGPDQAACQEAFAEAEAEGTDVDEQTLHATVTACEDIAAFRAAAEDHPDVLETTTPEVFLADLCQSTEDEEISGSSLCQDIAEGADP